MNQKHVTLAACLLAFGLTVQAQDGGISPDMLKKIQSSYQNTAADKALRNAMGGTSIKELALNQENQKALNTDFSIKVESKGITDQQSSGRCWLFTGLNVMRAKAIARYDLPGLEFSQVYSFFWDQLEKSNLFLQGVIETAGKPMNDQTVEWLFKHPLSDGGTFTGVADIVSKYGLVPKEAMPETYSSEHTSYMSSLIGLKLKEFGLELREMAAKGEKAATIESRKEEMLSTVYRMLVLTLGVPPTEFDYVRKDSKGNVVATEHHTPMSFLEKYGDTNLLTNYVMVMNDPSREYYKCYEIAYDRHRYDGKNWTYVNLPSDVTQLDSKRGLLDVNNYDFGSLMGTTFGMDKKERIQTFASMSAHAMTLMAVDLDANGKPKKWMVENSWGAASGYQGHLIMTDEWFNEYILQAEADTASGMGSDVCGRKMMTGQK